MSQTPFEQLSSLRIGSVDCVSPNEVKVVLDIEAPQSVALGVDGPRPFPRVNSYLIVPVDDGLLVGQVEWLVVDHSPFPKRRGLQDFGVVDLPYPLRKLRLNPLGTLRRTENLQYTFRRGADAMPSVGAAVLLPTADQLRAIVESGDRRRVRIGTSPIAGDAEVSVDPDRLFGRHLAVLGNTGSGKSCSVAGLIRWSLEKATEATEATEAKEKRGEARPNARFIILDPNGEYTRAFSSSDVTKARVFSVRPTEDQIALQVPLWFWNSAEWCAFTRASAKTQRPALLHALQAVRDGKTEPTSDASHEMRRFLRTLVATVRIEQSSGSPWGSFPKPKGFFEKLEKWRKALESDLDSFSGEEQEELQHLVQFIEELCRPRRAQYPSYDFRRDEVKKLLETISRTHSTFGGSESDLLLADVDAPRPFRGTSLVRATEAVGEMLNVTEHIETLLLRIRSLLADIRMKPIMEDAVDIKLYEWLSSYIGTDKAQNGCVAVIDLSLVPTEVVHVITAVIARMVFEALQQYMRLNDVALPTVLVMEEAHTFVKRGVIEDAENRDVAAMCCQVFERIAREGRKFGLGLVLSSQRPSELSPTVLSQCNSFLLHRITNDRDQDLIQRLVPDNLRGLLRELPSLPSQNAVLLGWASELPVLVRMDDLPTAQQPRSDDPEFWDVWTGEKERNISWEDIAQDWQAGSSEKQSDMGQVSQEPAEQNSEERGNDHEVPF